MADITQMIADIIRAHFLELILILLVLYALITTHNSITKQTSAVEKTVADAIKESKTQIEDSIRPRVVFCASIDQVRSEAADIILDAVERFTAAVETNTRSKMDGHDKEVDVSQYFITIYGAASLSIERGAETNPANPLMSQSINKYHHALQQASASKLRFRRYVSLLDELEVETRSKSIQLDYLGWLKRQQTELINDPTYTMILSPRAPRWGSSNTSIIGNAGIIEIKGHGGSAFAIHDPRIASDLRASLRADIDGTLRQNRRDVFSGDEASMSWLATFIDKCEKAASGV